MIGFDFGSWSTKLAIRGTSVLRCEPSQILLKSKTGSMVSFGQEAVLGSREKGYQKIPFIKRGVLVDQDALASFSHQAMKHWVPSRYRRGMIKVAVPAECSPLQLNGTLEAFKNAGYQKVSLVPTPLAISECLDLSNPYLSTVVLDVGQGKLSLSAILEGKLIASETLSIGLVDLQATLVKTLRQEFGLTVTMTEAHNLLHSKFSLFQSKGVSQDINGRDAVDSLPRTVRVEPSFGLENFRFWITQLDYCFRKFFSKLTPQVVADIGQTGVHIVGGGSELDGWYELCHHMWGLDAKVYEQGAFLAVQGLLTSTHKMSFS